MKIAIADGWTVGNGIAFAAAERYVEATGRTDVTVAGTGIQLHAKVE